jgi:hypothetical protein
MTGTLRSVVCYDHPGSLSAGGSTRFVVIVGNPQPLSRTLQAASAAADAVVAELGLYGYEVIDLSVLSRRLLLPEPSAAVEDAADAAAGADLLLVASPTFKVRTRGCSRYFSTGCRTGTWPGAEPGKMWCAHGLAGSARRSSRPWRTAKQWVLERFLVAS